MLNPILTFIIGTFLFCASPLTAQTPIFTNDDPVVFTLAVDLSALLEDRKKDEPDYREARISLNEASTVRDLEVKVKAGGNFRKNPLHCSFPPLRLKFKKDEVKGSLFAGNTKFKLVTPCASDNDVLKEYLVYKMYQELSPVAFQVRLVNVSITDLANKLPTSEFLGFLIEDDDVVAERNGGKIENNALHAEQFNRKQITQLAIFQYAIGNRDWDLALPKNIKRMDRGEDHFAIPYDFDFTGIVAPSYVLDLMSGDINSLREFPDLCRSEEEIKEALKVFQEVTTRWGKLIKEFDLLPKNEQGNMQRYLKVFINQLKSPDKLATRLAKRCK